ncbi:MAG: NAD-dependent epimerase/dehydratase family protein [Deltaproteobacteria bacterium]|nr:NAD-dependent epimerase/dehydratase family protein [Deltaproteobacteria bacterium]
MPWTRRRFLSASGSALAAAALDARAEGPGPAPRKLRLLILGGTAFLGPELVEAARGRGHTVTLFNRGKTRPELFPDVEKLHGDRDGKLDALRGRAWDAVVDTSGYVPRLVRASAELLAPRVPLYVFVSSISAYADSPKGPTEDSPVQVLEDPKTEDVRAHYGALKAACEKAAAEATGGRSLAVRPGLIVGPGDPTDRFTYWPVRLDRGGEVLCPGDGSDPAQVVDVRDLAAYMVKVVEDGRTGTHNAVGPAAPLTMAGLVEACRAPGSAATLSWVDAAFLEKEKVAPWGDLPVWIPSGRESAGMTRVSNARAVAAGLRFRPLAETARDTLAWWKGLPAERRQKPRAGLSAEREAAVLAAWKKEKAPATGR